MYNVVLALFCVEFGCCCLNYVKLDVLYLGDEVLVMGGAVNDNDGVDELVAVMGLVGMVTAYGVSFLVALQMLDKGGSAGNSEMFVNSY